MRVVRDDPEALEVEGTWGPNGSPPPKHFHPSQDERFEVLEGMLTARVDGEERELGPGDVLEIPRGAVHQMWNAAGVPAKATWRTSPAGRTRQWFATWTPARSGRVGGNGMPAPGVRRLPDGVPRRVRLAGPQPMLVRW